MNERNNAMSALRWLIVVICAIFVLSIGLRWVKTFDDIASTTTTTVVSADFTTQVQGASGTVFYIGHGSLRSEEYYVAYEREEDGGLVLKKYPCDKTILYTTLAAGDTAYVEKDLNEYGSVLAYRLYVPEGSVVQEYDLSLQS